MKNYEYSAYGLNITSTIRLPELPSGFQGDPDVTIKLGEVPEKLDSGSENGLLWQSEPGKLLLTVEDVVRYLVIENREVVIHPAQGTPESRIRTFLLGSIMASLLYARQVPIIHSSVINTKNGAVMFMGRSGAGKSTLLAAFIKRGYEMIADDKAAIVFDDNRIAQVLPAFPAARIMKTTAKHLEIPIDDSCISEGKRKFVVPVEKFASGPTKLHAAYSIKPFNKEEITLLSLGKLDKFRQLNRHTYRRRFLQERDQKRSHLNTLSKLSEQINVIKVSRPNNPKLINKLADKIEEDFNR